MKQHFEVLGRTGQPIVGSLDVTRARAVSAIYKLLNEGHIYEPHRAEISALITDVETAPLPKLLTMTDVQVRQTVSYAYRVHAFVFTFAILHNQCPHCEPLLISAALPVQALLSDLARMLPANGATPGATEVWDEILSFKAEDVRKAHAICLIYNTQQKR